MRGKFIEEVPRRRGDRSAAARGAFAERNSYSTPSSTRQEMKMEEGFWAKILNPGGRSWDPIVTPIIEGVTSEVEYRYGKIFVAIEIGNNGEVIPFLPRATKRKYENDSGARRMASVGKAVIVVPPDDYNRDATAEELLGWVEETI